MDLLIKNNVIKQTRLIVDIGMYRTKVLEVRYEAKNIHILSAKSFESTAGGEMNFADIARRVRGVSGGSGQKNVVVILPAGLTENRVASFKNIKETELSKAVENESFRKVSPATYEIDYAYLGKRDEPGDTVRYCLMAAVAKSVDNEIVSEFQTCGMKVISVVTSVYAGINLSGLFFDDYEHPNHLMVDFGRDSMRLSAISDGVAVYTRVIALGRASYEDALFNAQDDAGRPEISEALEKVGCKPMLTPHSRYFEKLDEMLYFDIVKSVNTNIIGELSRVLDLCETNEIPITKIYFTGRPIFGFEKAAAEKLGTECEIVDFRGVMEKEGRDYVICFDAETDREFANAVGMVISPFLQ